MLPREIPARIFLFSHRAFRVVHGATQALVEGFWMGLLSERACDVISQRSYGNGTEYTNPRYLDSGLQFWEDLVVQRFFLKKGRVLVAAAGGGREMIALARRGFEADGFECSRQMVAAGSAALAERGIRGTLAWAPPCQVPRLDATYDALIVGWNGYTYIAPRERRVAFMREIGSHLRPGAPVLVSAAMRYGPSSRSAWTSRFANTVRVCTFRQPVFGPGAIFPGRPRYEFTRKEIERELADAGFSPVAFYHWGGYCAVVSMFGEDTLDG